MECIEARALKPSFLSQMAMKANSQVYYNDDVWCLTGVNNVVSDDFPVEDLLNLDLPEKDIQELCFSQEDEEDASQNGNSIYSSSSSSTFSGADDFDTLSAAELAVPVDGLENLEWLSQFVDDSTSEVSLLCPAGSFMAQTGVFSVNRSQPVHRPPQRNPVRYFPVPVPVKARSKRPRPAGRPWYLASPALSSVDSTSTTSSSHGSSTLPPFVFASPVHDTEWLSSVEKPAAKKQKRKTEADTGPVSSRRCTHCQVQKTPQWRTGPLGPKTLCNACGVRFKSGRLFPEYRPAFSPTYSKELHSNSHRKVLEMRQKKEKILPVESDSTPSVEPDLTPAVQSQ